MAETPSSPVDPITALAEGAAQMHELYLAYVGAGFTPAQAMQLLCGLLAAATGQQAS